MQDLIKYIKHSNIIFTVFLNPFQWFMTPFYFNLDTESDMDPGMKLDLVIKVVFFKFMIFIDDGRW